jgi:hypothetical protein
MSPMRRIPQHRDRFSVLDVQVLKLSFNRLEELPDELSLFSSLYAPKPS